MTGESILVVEDNGIIALQTVELLEKNGYRIAGTTAFGKEAVAMATKSPPDLICMDIELMGKIDGIETARKIKATLQRITAIIQFTGEYEEIGVRAPLWHDCRRLVETTELQTRLGQVVVKNDLPAGSEMFADPMIDKVFFNQMDNAIWHGGKITFIRFYLKDSGGSHIIVCEDDGDGVVTDEKELIFHRGFGKNTGLGLFLAREILAITGITIRETGTADKGARFEITVPNGAWRCIQ